MVFNPKLSPREFLSRFFGDGNRFSLAEIESGEGKSSKILPWVNLLMAEEKQPTVLPRWVNSEVIWYGIAQNERHFRRLSDEILAFVGPTWSDFRGQRASLDPGDPVELAVLEWTGGSAFKIRGNAGDVWNAIERMRAVYDQRPNRSLEVPRPTGRVLRDFYMAVRAGNPLSAERELEYLQKQYQLDALNILFLRVYLLSELKLWDELLSLQEISFLLQSRRPAAVTLALIEAIYWKELAVFEDDNRPESAANHFHEFVWLKYGNLFSTHFNSTVPAVVKSFMILAVGGVNPNPELRDHLINIPGLKERDLSYLNSLASLLPTTFSRPAPEESFRAARKAVDEGDYDRAYSLSVQVELSLPWVRILFECAYELQTLEVEKKAIDSFNQLSEEEQESFLAIRWNRELLNQLTGNMETKEGSTTLEQAIPKDWIEWLEYLKQNPLWSRALIVAKQGAVEWQFENLISQPNWLTEVTADIQLLVGNNSLNEALPFLLAFFQKDDQWPRRECLPVYQLLQDVLVVSTSGGNDDLSIFNELAAILLLFGTNDDQYLELLGYAEELWEKYSSPAKVNWILDFLDSLLLYPSPKKEVRVRLLFSIVNKVRGFARRLDQGQKEFLLLLIRDLHQDEALSDFTPLLLLDEQQAESTPKDVFTGLSDLSVTIYTLTEAVADRVKKILESHCPTVSVSVSHDKVGSDRLKQLATNADIFLMATASATHAATRFIEANRPKDLPLLRPAGKGSASMLHSLRLYLENSVKNE